jgi:transcriptional regulator with XRE-family HTH domain
MPKESGLMTQRQREIGQRAKRFRDTINWPQSAFAAELGITRDRLASFEYGRTPLRYDIGYRLCYLFDVNHEWLSQGSGDMRAGVARSDLPAPEGQPRNALFSQVCDRVRGAKPGGKAASAAKAKAVRQAAKGKEGGLIPHFDPAAHVSSFMGDLFAREKFGSPLERQEFALEVTSYARELALRMRRESTKERYVAATGRRGAQPARQAGVRGVAGRRARMLLWLRESSRRLNQESERLSAALQKLDPANVNPAVLPRPMGVEVVRVQELIEKIGREIEEAEAKIKALMARKPADGAA